MIEITEKPISFEAVVDRVRSESSGCVIAYAGIIRDTSQGKPVVAIEFQDSGGRAKDILQQIANEVKERWQTGNIAMSRRIGKLRVGDINHMVAIASAHREEGFEACRYVVDQFKKRPPVKKIETFNNGDITIREAFQEVIK